jgi:hypothetical protein
MGDQVLVAARNRSAERERRKSNVAHFRRFICLKKSNFLLSVEESYK